MTEFVRPIHKHIEDLYIFDVEALCYLVDKSSIISQILSVGVSSTLF